MAENDPEPTRQIDDAHEGHQRRRHLADALDAAHDHQAHAERQKQAEDHGSERALEDRRDAGHLGVRLIGLEHVAAAEAPADAHHREDHRQHASESRPAQLRQAAAQEDHGPAGHMTVLARDAVLLAEGALGELRAHAEEPGQDHPEHGAGPAEAHRHRHARDVAQTHRGGERGGQRLEVRDLARLARVRVAPAHAVDRVPEGAEVHELEAQREVERAEDQPHHHQRRLDLVATRVVPESDVEKDDRLQRIHHDHRKQRVEQAQEGTQRSLLRGVVESHAERISERPRIIPHRQFFGGPRTSLYTVAWCTRVGAQATSVARRGDRDPTPGCPRGRVGPSKWPARDDSAARVLPLSTGAPKKELDLLGVSRGARDKRPVSGRFPGRLRHPPGSGPNPLHRAG